MKIILFLIIGSLLLGSCGNSTNQNESSDEVAQAEVQDSSLVYIYYFHGEKRCKTCNAIEEVVSNFYQNNYVQNEKVLFKVFTIGQEQSKALEEKFEVSWSSLVISKGDNFTNITDEAFANAVNNPDTLTTLIESEISKRL